MTFKLINSVYRNCLIVIQAREFLADLITLPFREFDLILGMDWLTKHRAIVNCRQKTVVLRYCDALNPGGPLTTRQPAEYS